MSKPIFVPPTNSNQATILANPLFPNSLISVFRRKWYRFFQETIILPRFLCSPLVAQDVSEALYMAAVKAAQITNKRSPGKHGGNPVAVNGDTLQVFANDPRYVITLIAMPQENGGGTWVSIPAHTGLDIPSAIQFARVISQAAELAGEKNKSHVSG